MVLVHHPIRQTDDYGFSLKDVKRLIDLHERILGMYKHSPVVAIAINTAGMDPAGVAAAKNELISSTHLPAGNVLSADIRDLGDAILNYFQTLTPSLD